jgi:hypothetical protein
MELLGKDAGDLPARLGVAHEGFLERWVAAEATAKVADTPIVLWIKRHGLAADPGVLRQTVAGRAMAFCRGAE